MVELDKPYFTSNDKNIVVTFEHDEFPESPREWSSTTFVTWLRNHCSPNENDYDDPNELLDELQNGDYYWSKVYATIHSGIWYFRPGMRYFDQWDSGFAGFIFIKKEDASKNYNINSEKDAFQLFDNELEDYTRWCNGECYCCSIEYLDDDESVYYTGYFDLDSCVESVGSELGFTEDDLIEARIETTYV